MPKSDFTSAVNRWRVLGAQAKAQGIKDEQWKPLAQKDIQSVLGGASPMTNAEIHDSLLSVIKGSPVINQDSGSSPSDLFGNFASDVADLTTGLIPGIAHYITSLPEQLDQVRGLLARDPKTYAQLGWELPDSGDSLFNVLGKALRDAPKTPVFGALVPGLHTAGALTTEKGRTELAQHPAMTALDVLPVAAEAGRAASAGADVANMADSGGLTERMAPAVEALQKGNPVKAAYRAATDLATTPNRLRFADRQVLGQQLYNMGMHPDLIREITKPYTAIKQGATHDSLRFVQDELFQRLKALTPEERRNLTEVAKEYDPNSAAVAALSPEHQQILSDVKKIESRWANDHPDDLVTTVGPGGHEVVYSADSPVVKLKAKADRAYEVAQQSTARVIAQRAKLADYVAKFEGKYGKIRKFMESDDTFNARPAAPVTLPSIHDAATPLIESFAHRDPIDVYRGIAGAQTSKGVGAALAKDIKLLSGDRGAFAQLDEAFKTGDMKQVRFLMTQIRRIFAKDTWARTPYQQTFLTHIGDLRDAMFDIRNKARSLGYSEKMVNSAQQKLARFEARYKTTSDISNAKQARYLTEHKFNPPANYHPALADMVRHDAATAYIAKVGAVTQDVQEVVGKIMETPDFAEIKRYLGAEETNQLVRDVKAHWIDMAKQGVDPIFMHTVSRDALDYVLHPQVLPDRLFKPSMYEDKVLNLGNTVNDFVASVAGYHTELISEAATRQFFTDHIAPRMRELGPTLQEYMDALRHDPRISTDTLVGQAKSAMKKEWTTIDPESGLARYLPITRGKEYVIPKGIDTTLRQMMKDDVVAFKGAYNKSMNLYKYAVLTTPRHMAHIAFGGMMFGALREPGMFLKLPEAYRMVKEGLSPNELPESLYGLPLDHLYHYSAGVSLGRVLKEAGAKFAHFEETISQMQRVAGMLSAEARGLSRDEAIAIANKTFVDMSNMLPIERVAIKQLFPFYAFTKHLFRYLFTYPVDHPLRASILSHFGQQEQDDWNKGLPDSMQLLMFLGSPDAAGNVSTIDVRSLNPFRSFYNQFSLAGVISSLNPYATSLMSAAGVNVLSGSQELYPELAYDQQTGTLVAKRQNVLGKIVGSFIPETTAVDYLYPFSDKMKSLMKSNPDAAKKALFTALGIPFAPGTVNVPQTVAKTERLRYRVAQTAVADAVRTGDFAGLAPYKLVPVPSLFKRYIQGAYTTPAQLEQVYRTLAAQYAPAVDAGASLKAVVPHIRR